MAKSITAEVSLQFDVTLRLPITDRNETSSVFELTEQAKANAREAVQTLLGNTYKSGTATVTRTVLEIQ